MITPETAREILRLCGIDRGENFHALNSDRVILLLDAANEHRYRKPKNANGSRCRYFHAYLQRLAAKS